jgi:hypothetical protein
MPDDHRLSEYHRGEREAHCASHMKVRHPDRNHLSGPTAVPRPATPRIQQHSLLRQARQFWGCGGSAGVKQRRGSLWVLRSLEVQPFACHRTSVRAEEIVAGWVIDAPYLAQRRHHGAELFDLIPCTRPIGSGAAH